jgi:hypothetical protein
MRQIRKRMQEKYPRVHKIISKSSNLAFHVGYWGVLTVIVYTHVFQYSARGYHDSINK